MKTLRTLILVASGMLATAGCAHGTVPPHGHWPADARLATGSTEVEIALEQTAASPGLPQAGRSEGAGIPDAPPAIAADYLIENISIVDVEKGAIQPGNYVAIAGNKIAGVYGERVTLRGGGKTIDGSRNQAWLSDRTAPNGHCHGCLCLELENEQGAAGQRIAHARTAKRSCLAHQESGVS